MTKDVETIREWITRINDEAVNLNDFEKDFMIGITDQFERSNWISNRQEEVLERIYAEKTS